MEGGPFREQPKLLLCPRCGEMLDRAFDAVLVCLRCEGVWITPIVLQAAFGSVRWPEGRNAWWRSSLACPECALAGTTALMGAQMVDDQVLVDRCDAHGLWLDRGELGRLMGGALADDRGDDDLAALRDRLHAVDSDLDRLVERREAWRSDAEIRRKSASEYRAWLDAEQERRDEIARAERERLEASRRATADQAERERRRLADERAERDAGERAERERLAAAREAARVAARASEDAERQRAEARAQRDLALQKLGDARAQASSAVARLESQLVQLRSQLHAVEAELGGARARLRVVDERLDALERQRV